MNHRFESNHRFGSVDYTEAAAGPVRQELETVCNRLGKIIEDLGGSASQPPNRLLSSEVRQFIAWRDRRRRFFADDLFADPAWDMLLDLYANELAQQRVSVSSLCIASRVPPTTALRWIGLLEQKNLVLREADPLDGRRYFVRLTPAGRSAMQAMFTDDDAPRLAA